MEKHQKNRLLIATVAVLIMLTVYNLLWGPTPEAPLWGKFLFPLLQAVWFYYFMRWVTMKYARPKQPENES